MAREVSPTPWRNRNWNSPARLHKRQVTKEQDRSESRRDPERVRNCSIELVTLAIKSPSACCQDCPKRRHHDSSCVDPTSAPAPPKKRRAERTDTKGREDDAPPGWRELRRIHHERRLDSKVPVAPCASSIQSALPSQKLRVTPRTQEEEHQGESNKRPSHRLPQVTVLLWVVPVEGIEPPRVRQKEALQRFVVLDREGREGDFCDGGGRGGGGVDDGREAKQLRDRWEEVSLHPRTARDRTNRLR